MIQTNERDERQLSSFMEMSDDEPPPYDSPTSVPGSSSQPVVGQSFDTKPLSTDMNNDLLVNGAQLLEPVSENDEEQLPSLFRTYFSPMFRWRSYLYIFYIMLVPLPLALVEYAWVTAMLGVSLVTLIIPPIGAVVLHFTYISFRYSAM